MLKSGDKKMKRTPAVLSVILLAAAILFGLSSFARADLTQSDTNEINQYKLTDKALGQYFQAIKNLLPVVQKNPRLKERSDDDDDDVNSLSQLVQEFDGIPGAKKAVEDAGLTTREFLVFQFSLMTAIASSYIQKSGGELPPEFSKQNVEFFHAHEDEFRKHQQEFLAVSKFTSDKGDQDEP
jgi:hypothetical protein